MACSEVVQGQEPHWLLKYSSCFRQQACYSCQHISLAHVQALSHISSTLKHHFTMTLPLTPSSTRLSPG